MRITNQEIYTRLSWINKTMRQANAPEFEIDHYSPGGNPYTWKLTTNNGSHPVTNYRMTKPEFYAYLNGMIDALETTRKDDI